MCSMFNSGALGFHNNAKFFRNHLPLMFFAGLPAGSNVMRCRTGVGTGSAGPLANRGGASVGRFTNNLVASGSNGPATTTLHSGLVSVNCPRGVAPSRNAIPSTVSTMSGGFGLPRM